MWSSRALLSVGYRRLLLSWSSRPMATMRPVSASDHAISSGKENFFDKNDRLARPTSPHLTIYKPQLTSLLSITHRGTGLFQSALMTGFAVYALTNKGNFGDCLASLQSAHYGSATIFAAKFVVAFPFAYHLLNGCRHLVGS